MFSGKLTVARITARFQKMIDDLERVEKESRDGAQFHIDEIAHHLEAKSAHEREAEAGRVVAQKIRALISAEPAAQGGGG